jgi:cobalt/nickel transport system permease protein
MTSGAITDSLYGAQDSRVSRVDPAVALACLVVFVLAVVLTPPEALWAFGIYAVLVGIVACLARIPVRVMARRMLVETPFVLFGAALPFIGSGPRTEVLGLSVSVQGCWAAWAILAKATLGVAASVVLAWSIPAAELLTGLERLRCPRVLVAIAGFMVRYLDVVAGELHRLQIARISRGDDPRWLWQGRAIATTAGTVFVRSFERGERIQQAMTARGFTGSFPCTVSRGESPGLLRAALCPAMLIALAAVAVAAAANLAVG